LAAQVKTVAIIPALNEEAAIGDVVRGLPSNIEVVLVVDNGSTDRTANRAREAGATVVLQPKRGYGAACMAGVHAAPDAGVYLFLDGDGSDPPARAANLLQALDTCGADLVLGLRLGDLDPGAMFWHQRLGNLAMTWLIRRLSGRPVHDLSSFKAVRGPVLRALDLRQETYGWTAELIMRCACGGLKIEELETGYRRRIGHSKVSGSIRTSLLAGLQLNAAILGAWYRERRGRRLNPGPQPSEMP
jgi:glycosyltransferase involved in cell wall biosynthesis